MFRKFQLLALVLVFAIAGNVSAQTSLDQLIPANRQKQLGFDKLSAQERAEVVKLLQEVYQIGVQDGQKEVSGSQQKGTVGPSNTSVIEAQINGDFKGWEGETIVKLMNGQIWQQSEYYYHYYYAFMPKVIIYRNGGGYKMKVDGVEKPVGVVRLR